MTLVPRLSTLAEVGLAFLFGMALTAVLPWSQVQVLLGLLVAIELAKTLRSHSPDTETETAAPDPPQDTLPDGGHTTAPAAALDLDTTPLTRSPHQAEDDLPARITSDPAITVLLEQLPDTVGTWRAGHRLAGLGAEPFPRGTKRLLRWTASEDGKHMLVITVDNPEVDSTYEVYYQYDDLTTPHDSYRTRYGAGIHSEGFATAEAAVAYAIHWMETYPDGGPGRSPGLRLPARDQVPEFPRATAPTDNPAAYTVQTDPDTNMTTITQHGDP